MFALIHRRIHFITLSFIIINAVYLILDLVYEGDYNYSTRATCSLAIVSTWIQMLIQFRLLS